MWHESFRAHFLHKALRASRECRNFFYHHQKGFSDTEVDCNAVVLFWRVKKMLNITGNSLRQQIVNSEGEGEISIYAESHLNLVLVYSQKIREGNKRSFRRVVTGSTS